MFFKASSFLKALSVKLYLNNIYLTQLIKTSHFYCIKINCWIWRQPLHFYSICKEITLICSSSRIVERDLETATIYQAVGITVLVVAIVISPGAKETTKVRLFYCKIIKFFLKLNTPDFFRLFKWIFFIFIHSSHLSRQKCYSNFTGILSEYNFSNGFIYILLKSAHSYLLLKIIIILF